MIKMVADRLVTGWRAELADNCNDRADRRGQMAQTMPRSNHEARSGKTGAGNRGQRDRG